MHSILIGAGKVLYSIVIFLLTVFAAHYFSVSDYGLFREFYLYFIIGISVSGIPAVNALYYFTNHNRKIILFLFMLSSVLAFTVLAVIWGFSRNDMLPAVMLSIPASVVYLLLDAHLISKRAFVRAFSLTMIESLTFMIPIPLLIIFNMNIFQYILIFSVIALFKFAIYSVLVILSVRDSHDDLLIDVFKYIFPVYINNLVGVISGKIDKYIVSAMFGPVTFAFYSSGAFEIPLIGRFINGVFHSNAANVREGLINKDYMLIKGRLTALLVYIFPIIGTLTLLFAINAERIISLLYSPIYQDAFLFFTVYLMVLPFRLVPLGFFMNLSGKTKQLMILGICDAILTIILSLLLIKMMGPIGGAIAFITVTLIQILFITYFIRSFFPVRFYFFQNILILLFINIGILLNFNNGYHLYNNTIIIIFIALELLIIKWSRLWK